MNVEKPEKGEAVEPAVTDQEQPDLVQLIQLHALRQDPTRLTIESASHQVGWVCVHRGDVFRAYTSSGKEGFPAFVEIVSWEGPQVVQLERDNGDIRNIDLPLPKLLIEAFWEAQCHSSDEPPMDDIPMGLEEDTVTGKSDFGPPDGVTKVVIETAQLLSRIKGFVAVALIGSKNGKVIEILGDKSNLEVPAWLECMVRAQRDTPDLENVVFSTSSHVDVLVRPVGDADISYYLRMDRATTNRGLLEVGLRQARDKGLNN